VQQLGDGAAHEGAPAGRRLGAPERKGVALAEVGRERSIRGSASRRARTVTPSAIANGSASPPL
jgi:hypothetical protein